MQPLKYFSILKLKYDYTLLSLHTFLLYESLHSKNPETIEIFSIGKPDHRTIMIVLSNTTIYTSYYRTR